VWRRIGWRFFLSRMLNVRMFASGCDPQQSKHGMQIANNRLQQFFGLIRGFAALCCSGVASAPEMSEALEPSELRSS
jgi:hypothetical protein